MQHEFVRRAVAHVDGRPTQPLTPALDEFRKLIEGEPRIYMYFTQMFEEIPKKPPYWNDVTGRPQVRDWKHMLAVLNHIVTRAPEWTDADEAVGVVGVPMCAIFDWPMGTPR